MLSYMRGQHRRTDYKLDYIHFMPDIRLRIKITIDIYTFATIQYIAMK